MDADMSRCPNADVQGQEPAAAQLAEPLGHYFADLSYGIDRERCVHCGCYRDACERTPVECIPSWFRVPIPDDFERKRIDRLESFKNTWAIRPELPGSNIHQWQDYPDVERFDTRDQLVAWLDEPVEAETEHGDPYCPWPPFRTRRDQRSWVRVAILRLSDYESKAFSGIGFKDYLLKKGIDDWPAFSHHELICRALTHRNPPISGCLGEEWDFPTMETDTHLKPGHELAGRRLRSFPRAIAHVVEDLQAIVRKRHPSLPASAEADFLESWEVQRHVAQFCGKELATGGQAQALMIRSRRDPSQLYQSVEAARLAVQIQLAVYAKAMRTGIDLKDPNASGSRTEDVCEEGVALALLELLSKLRQGAFALGSEMDESGLSCMGRVDIAGLEVDVFLYSLEEDEASFVSQCQRLRGSSTAQKSVLLTSQRPPLSIQSQQLLNSIGVIIVSKPAQSVSDSGGDRAEAFNENGRCLAEKGESPTCLTPLGVRRRRGFPANAEDHKKVYDAAVKVGGGDWASRLPEVCVELQKTGAVFPGHWRKDEFWESWEEVAEEIVGRGVSSKREKVAKYIRYRVAQAQRNQPAS